MLIEVKQEEADEIDPADMQNISRASSLRKRVSAMVRGINAIKSNTSSTGNRSLATVNSNFSIASTLPSNGSPAPVLMNQYLHQLPLQLNDQSSGSVALPKGQTSLRNKRSKSQTRHEEHYNTFQSGILDRGWLPVSTVLKSGNFT